MKEKSKYNFLHSIPLYYFKFFVTVFYYVVLKVVTFFVIISDQTGKANFSGRGQNLKKAIYF